MNLRRNIAQCLSRCSLLGRWVTWGPHGVLRGTGAWASPCTTTTLSLSHRKADGCSKLWTATLLPGPRAGLHAAHLCEPPGPVISQANRPLHPEATGAPGPGCRESRRSGPRSPALCLGPPVPTGQCLPRTCLTRGVPVPRCTFYSSLLRVQQDTVTPHSGHRPPGTGRNQLRSVGGEVLLHPHFAAGNVKPGDRKRLSQPPGRSETVLGWGVAPRA